MPLPSNSVEKLCYSHRIRCNDGTYKWILEQGKVIECIEPGVPSRVIGTSKDISKRKKFELSLHKSIETEKELSELKSRFVSMASHEFRTPLASILISADSLLTYWKTMDESQVKDKLVKIINQVHHLSNIVNDVLQLSKIEQKKIEFKPLELDLVNLCFQSVDVFNSDPGLKNKVKVRSHYDEVIMMLDFRLMLQVINNLVSNGIKFSVESTSVTVDIEKKGNEFCLIHTQFSALP